MRWEDERYVRLYTRDSIEWTMLSWEARGLFCLLLRVVDRAGLLPLGKHGVRGLANLLRAPADVVERVLDEWIGDGCVKRNGDFLLVPNFLQAQEASQTDAARKRAERERAAAQLNARKFGIAVTNRDQMSQNVTKCHELSGDFQAFSEAPEAPKTASPIPAESSPLQPTKEQLSEGNVTNRDQMSQIVTKCHVQSQDVTPSLAVPSLAVLNQERAREITEPERSAQTPDPVPPSPAGAGAPRASRPRRKVKIKEPIEPELLPFVDETERLSGVRYSDGRSWKALRSRLSEGGTIEEAFLVLRACAQDSYWVEKRFLDPVGVFNTEQWPKYLARARAQPRPKSRQTDLTKGFVLITEDDDAKFTREGVVDDF